MDAGKHGYPSVSDALIFLNYFSCLDLFRQSRKVPYPLAEVLRLAPRAVLAGADTFTDIAHFGAVKVDYSRRFRPFCDGSLSAEEPGTSTP